MSDPTATVAGPVPFENPETGNTITALRYVDETLEFEASIAPETRARPLPEFGFVRPDQGQAVTVIGGELHVSFRDPDIAAQYPHLRDGDLTLIVPPGERIELPPGAPHRVWNAGPKHAEVRVVVTPATGFEAFLRSEYQRGVEAHAPFAAFEESDDLIVNAVTGEKVRFIERAADTEGERLVYEHLLPPRVTEFNLYGKGIYLPNQTKYVRVIRGQVGASNLDAGYLQKLATHDYALYGAAAITGPGAVPIIGGIQTLKLPISLARQMLDVRRMLTVAPLQVLEDDEIRIATGTPYKLRNGGREDAIIRVEVTPALRTEQLLESLFGLAAEGALHTEGKKRGRPRDPDQRAVLRWYFKKEFQFPKAKTLDGAITWFRVTKAEGRGLVDWKPEYSPKPDLSMRAETLAEEVAL